MSQLRYFSPTLALITLSLAAACGSAADHSDESETAEARAQAASGASVAVATRDLSGADVDAFERGLQREADAVRAAEQRASGAETPEARGLAIQASFEEATIPLGAQAAGLSVDRYRSLRATVVEVLRTLDAQGKIDGPMEIDTLLASPEMRRRAAADPFAIVSPSTATAILSRLTTLARVWRGYALLTAVNG